MVDLDGNTFINLLNNTQAIYILIFSFMMSFVLVPIFLGFLTGIGFYVIVPEKTRYVYVLFGNVVFEISEPGIHFLWPKITWKALIVNWLGKCYVVDLRLDQQYLRSQPVNSEEGAPMGIGIWYEMYISDSQAYLFKNADPRGSLTANVSSSSIRCLSNMPLEKMLVDRHSMSASVREEVSIQSRQWGYQVGSVYIRKVHFRDQNMVAQIEGKVVNRLRQVTAAINQEGNNQVNVIKSTADKEAAHEFAKAAAIRPHIVGEALAKLGQDPEISESVFTVLEIQQMLNNKNGITFIPKTSSSILPQLLAAK